MFSRKKLTKGLYNVSIKKLGFQKQLEKNVSYPVYLWKITQCDLLNLVIFSSFSLFYFSRLRFSHLIFRQFLFFPMEVFYVTPPWEEPYCNCLFMQSINLTSKILKQRNVP